MLIIGCLRRIISRYVNIALECRPLGDTRQKGKNFIGAMSLRFCKNRLSTGQEIVSLNNEDLSQSCLLVGEYKNQEDVFVKASDALLPYQGSYQLHKNP